MACLASYEILSCCGILITILRCSLLKDKYYDDDAADNDKKEDEAAKKKANRPSK